MVRLIPDVPLRLQSEPLGLFLARTLAERRAVIRSVRGFAQSPLNDMAFDIPASEGKIPGTPPLASALRNPTIAGPDRAQLVIDPGPRTIGGADTNRDGMDIDCCRNVRVSNCTVNSPWDDGICLKSCYGLGVARSTDNVSITNCYVTAAYELGSIIDGTFRRIGPGYQSNGTGRIKLGTESNGGFRNIAISNWSLASTVSACRTSSWPLRPSSCTSAPTPHAACSKSRHPRCRRPAKRFSIRMTNVRGTCSTERWNGSTAVRWFVPICSY